MDIFDFMKWAIVVAGFYATITQLWQAGKMFKRKFSSSWVHLGLGVLMLYWTLYYLRSGLNLFTFGGLHQIYVRAPLLVTLVLIGAAGAYAIRRIK